MDVAVDVPDYRAQERFHLLCVRGRRALGAKPASRVRAARFQRASL